MPLSRALVDRCRRVYSREDPAQTWEEGGPPGGQAYGPWLSVRFRPQSQNEVSVGGRGGYAFIDGRARLLMGLRFQDGTRVTADDGTFLAFDADDMVEVESRELGSARWYVQGGVVALRRRRSLVGYRCDLVRARETQVTEEPLDSGNMALLAGPPRVPAGQGVESDTPTAVDGPVVDAWEGG